MNNLDENLIILSNIRQLYMQEDWAKSNSRLNNKQEKPCRNVNFTNFTNERGIMLFQMI